MAVAPAKAELCADVARERTSRGHYASFDFHFLRLAIELRQQAVDNRDHFWNVVDDDGVGSVIRYNVAALREELFHRGYGILRLGVAEETGYRNLFHCQRFGFDL